MSKFSVVIITLNEERNISKCIDAALMVSDDIIIVDAKSNDNTVKIAKEKGAKVYIQEWKGYSKAKNFGAKMASNDWIISIDADEVISEKLSSSIQNIDLKDNTVYQINVLSNFLGSWVKFSGWYPSWKKRIYNKTLFGWNNAEVHEALTGKIDYELLGLEGNLLHFSYQSPEDVEIKIERYSKLLAKEIIKKGKRIGVLKRLFGPTYKFINTFIFKLGILDGITGYKISIMNAKVVRGKIKHYDYLTKNKKKLQ